MIIGPKYKICKRLGSGVFDKCQTQKFTLADEKSKKKGGSKKRPKQMSNTGNSLSKSRRCDIHMVLLKSN